MDINYENGGYTLLDLVKLEIEIKEKQSKKRDLEKDKMILELKQKNKELESINDELNETISKIMGSIDK